MIRKCITITLLILIVLVVIGNSIKLRDNDDYKENNNNANDIVSEKENNNHLKLSNAFIKLTGHKKISPLTLLQVDRTEAKKGSKSRRRNTTSCNGYIR